MIRKTAPKALYKKYSSPIHGKGLLATCSIEPGTKIIEYIGEHITKKESERRISGTGTRKKPNVYIFELNKRYDIDGNIPANSARWINHSCNPNCEAVNLRGHIWIRTLKPIASGEEFTFNYGYSPETFLDNPCRCQSEGCIGYIVREDARTRVKRYIKRQSKKPRI